MWGNQKSEAHADSWRVTLCGLVILLPIAVGCGDDPTDPGNLPPAIAPIDDRTVVRNTLTPNSVVIDLVIQDPDDEELTISVSSDDAAVLPDFEQTCAPGSCTLTLTPLPDGTARVAVTVAVTDDEDARAETSLMLSVLPVLVTTPADQGAGSLRRAVVEAGPGDVIGFDTDAAFAAPRTIALLGQIVIGKSLTIEGTGAANLTVSGENVARVFHVTDGANVTLSDLTITKGFAPVTLIRVGSQEALVGMGGGVLVDAGSRLTIVNSVITGNRAEGSQPQRRWGGGIANFDATLVVTNSEISANSAIVGAGIFTLAAGQTGEAVTAVDGSLITENTASGQGGGLYVSRGALRVRDSRIVANTAQYGAGILNESGALILESGTEVVQNVAAVEAGGIRTTGVATISGAVIARNSATIGAGISNEGTLLVQENTRIADNTGMVDPFSQGYGGGGIFNWLDGTATIVESVIEGNSTPHNGAGVFNQGRLTLQESIVRGNEAHGHGGGFFLSGAAVLEVIGTTCLILENVADADGDNSGLGGGIYSPTGDITGVPFATVCSNTPQDIYP